jgi:hypothetical protein
MHSRRTCRTGIGWIGIALILLNLCAPALTHALQLGRQGAAASGIHSPDWCGSLAPLATAAVGSDSGDSGPGAPGPTDAHAPACGYCAQTTLSWAPPPPPIQGSEAPAPDGEVLRIASPGQPAAPAYPSARPRAPPARNA